MTHTHIYIYIFQRYNIDITDILIRSSSNLPAPVATFLHGLMGNGIQLQLLNGNCEN